jgi:hypothetical protein
MHQRPAFLFTFFAILLAAGPLLFAGWVAGIRTIASYAITSPAPIMEAGSITESSSGIWWVNSGAAFYPDGSAGGRTVRGELPTGSTWQVAYAAANPVDTDVGYHPQNIFRLVNKTKRSEVAQQAYFTIEKYYGSTSPNRNQSNGILFFNRYVNSDNLYYIGLRVDGNAVVKKKKNGTYYTLALNKIITDKGEYNAVTNPNLLPTNTPIGMRSEVRTFKGGRVGIRLYVDIGKTGTWTRVADVIDDGVSYGGASILDSGYGGVRTDFMDANFVDYKMTAPPAT